MTRNMFVDIKNVSKNLTDFSLENLNISFEKGEIIGLVGENGA
ncbi:ABC transporter ATP-binding protein, partial [Lactobacillus salivarius]|nr:ABC transporter ATP-binding protein [Ligilactobacillus salivarius]